MKRIAKVVFIFVFLQAGTGQLFAQQMEAEHAYREKDWSRTIELSEKWANIEPGNGKPWYLWGMSLYHKGDYLHAALNIDKAVKYGIAGENSYFNLACAWSCSNNKGKAIDALKRSVATGLIFASQLKDPDLKSIQDEPEVKQIIKKLKDRPTITLSGPVLSPDGSKILFDSNVTGNHELYLINTDGGNLKRITNDPHYDGMAPWSPDGTRIIYSSGVDFNSDVSGTRDICIINSDGSDKIILTTPGSGNNHYGAMSPDGAKIVFNSDRDGHREIYVMNANGTDQRRLTNTNSPSDYPSWSPDGLKIIFESLRTGKWETYIMNKDGSSQVSIGVASAPVFSSDGSKVFFHKTRFMAPSRYIA